MGQLSTGHHTSDLPRAEQTLLWSMRAWVVCQHLPAAAVLEKIAATFADLGAPACAGLLDGFMWALRHGAVRTIGIDCPCRPTVDRDERVLLRVFALAQHGDRPTAGALLHDMVTPGSAAVAVDSAARLGAVLTEAGWAMKRRLPRATP